MKPLRIQRKMKENKYAFWKWTYTTRVIRNKTSLKECLIQPCKPWWFPLGLLNSSVQLDVSSELKDSENIRRPHEGFPESKENHHIQPSYRSSYVQRASSEKYKLYKIHSFP